MNPKTANYFDFADAMAVLLTVVMALIVSVYGGFLLSAEADGIIDPVIHANDAAFAFVSGCVVSIACVLRHRIDAIAMTRK